MLTVYVAIHITPDNLFPIKAMLGTDFPRWEELLDDRLKSRDEFSIVFDFIKTAVGEKPAHLIMPNSVINERCHVAKYTEIIDWIAEK